MKIEKFEQLKDGMRVKAFSNYAQRWVRGTVDCDSEGAGLNLDMNYSNYPDHLWSKGGTCSDKYSHIETLEGVYAVKVGDIMINTNLSADDEYRVLEVLENTVFLTGLSILGPWFTFEELKRDGFKIKAQEEKKEDGVIELTLKEVAEKFNIPIDKLRIKDNK